MQAIGVLRGVLITSCGLAGLTLFVVSGYKMSTRFLLYGKLNTHRTGRPAIKALPFRCDGVSYGPEGYLLSTRAQYLLIYETHES